MTTRSRSLAIIATVALLGTACGGGDDGEVSAGPTTTASDIGSPSPTPTDGQGSPDSGAQDSSATASPTPTPTSQSQSSSTPSPSPSPTGGSSGQVHASDNPLVRDEITMNPKGTEFTEKPVSLSRSRSNSGSCPLPSARNTQIVSCAEANASGGLIAVTVEENGDKFFATIWKIKGGNTWEPVVQTPIYSRQGGSGGSPDPVQIVPESTDFLQVFNVLYVGFDWGGSGGYWTYEIIDWGMNDSEPQVAVMTSGRPAASITPWAGNLLLQANHFKQSDATCCPSEREFLMIEHPDGRTRVPAVSTIVARDETTPEVLAKDVYLAWINGNLGNISNQRISSQARQWLQNNGGGGMDDHVLQSPICPWNGNVFECTLISTAWRLTWRIQPGHGGTTPTGAHRLVEIVEHSP